MSEILRWLADLVRDVFRTLDWPLFLGLSALMGIGLAVLYSAGGEAQGTRLMLAQGARFGVGVLAGRIGGDKLSLGFVVETERQVEAHLASHMSRLPAGDAASRAIVAQMKEDEAHHAEEALAAGGAPLPAPVRGLMRVAAKVMTTVAHRI